MNCFVDIEGDRSPEILSDILLGSSTSTCLSSCDSAKLGIYSEAKFVLVELGAAPHIA